MNRLRYLTIAAVLAAVHLLLALSSLLVSFSLGMGRFDSGGDMSQLESLARPFRTRSFRPCHTYRPRGCRPRYSGRSFLETAFSGVLFLRCQYGQWRDW